MAVKVSSKVNATKKQAANAVKPVALSASIASLIGATASSSYASQIAATSHDQSIVTLGAALWKDMGKLGREVVSVSIEAPFAKAYREANDKLNMLKDPMGKPYGPKNPHPKYKDADALKLYIGQQRSRVLVCAFPGGKEASEKESNAARVEMAKAIAARKSQPDVIKVASGNFKLDAKSGDLVRVKEHRRGGHNKATPFEAIKKTLKDAIAQAKSAKLSKAQFMTALYDEGIEAKWWADIEEMGALCK